MGRRTTPDRERIIARLFQSEVGERCHTWLKQAGVDPWRRELAEKIRHYDDAGGPEEFLIVPYGISEEDEEALILGYPARREAWRPRRLKEQADWLTRHLLDPNSAELLVPKDFTLALRARLLAKVRDDARRARGFRTIRIDAATAHWLDLLARHRGLGSRSEAVEEMVRVITGPDSDRAAEKE